MVADFIGKYTGNVAKYDEKKLFLMKKGIEKLMEDGEYKPKGKNETRK